MSTDTKPNDTPLHGVSLARYAAVNAAVAEGFSLEQVLETERVDAHSFERADVKWKKRLADAVSTPDGLVQRYQAELAAAEDWLTRKVTPLDSDLAAWMIFLNAYSSAPNPADLLARHGLGMNDLSRLSRLWQQRIEEDPSLGQRVTSLPTNDDVPPIEVDPPLLKRARTGGAAAAAKERPQAPTQAKDAGATPLDIERFGLDRYAQLCAELELFPDEAKRIRTKLGLESVAAHLAISSQFQSYIAADPQREREFKQLQESALARIEKWAGRTTAAERAQMNVSGGGAPVLPTFLARQGEAQRLEIGKDHLSVPDAEPPPLPPPAPPVPRANPLLTTAVHPASDTGTVEASIERAPLPFDKAEAATALARAVAHADAVQGPAAEKLQGGGTLSVATAAELERALPFLTKADAAGAGERHHTPGAPAASKGPARAREARPQVLELKRYVSLTVELSLKPAQRAETLARYRLTEDDKTQLDTIYQRSFAANPAARAAFEQAMTTYRAWLASRNRK